MNRIAKRARSFVARRSTPSFRSDGLVPDDERVITLEGVEAAIPAVFDVQRNRRALEIEELHHGQATPGLVGAGLTVSSASNIQ